MSVQDTHSGQNYWGLHYIPEFELSMASWKNPKNSTGNANIIYIRFILRQSSIAVFVEGAYLLWDVYQRSIVVVSAEPTFHVQAASFGGGFPEYGLTRKG